MTFEDYLDIMNVIARYGHAIDSGDASFDDVLTPDVEFDFTRSGPGGAPGPVVRGRADVLVAMTGSPDPSRDRPAGMRPALSHHTTNSEIVEDRGDEVDVRSKFLRLGSPAPGPMPVLIGQYLDTLVRTPQGWRIRRREVIAHGA